MRPLRILLLLFFISPVCAYSQLNGQYCFADMFTLECFEFFPDSCFRYYDRGCTGADYAEGHYVLDDTTLILTFGDGANTDFISTPILNKDKQYAMLDVHVFQKQNGLCFPNVRYILQDSDSTVIAQGETDSLGAFKIRTLKSHREKVLVVSYGWEKEYYCLMMDDSYSIQIQLQNNDLFRHIMSDGIVQRYRISIADDSVIFLKPLWYNTHLQEYRKGHISIWKTIPILPPLGKKIELHIR